MPFNHNGLIVLVRNVNIRPEKHGDEDKLAVDVSLWLKPGDDGEQWDAVLGGLFDMEPDAVSDFVAEEGQRYRTLPLVNRYEDHTVRFYAAQPGLFDNGAPLAVLSGAKINAFNFEFATEKHDDRVLFRVQALADGETVGALAEVLSQWVRIESVYEGPKPETQEQDEREAAEA